MSGLSIPTCAAVWRAETCKSGLKFAGLSFCGAGCGLGAAMCAIRTGFRSCSYPPPPPTLKVHNLPNKELRSGPDLQSLGNKGHNLQDLQKNGVVPALRCEKHNPVAVWILSRPQLIIRGVSSVLVVDGLGIRAMAFGCNSFLVACALVEANFYGAAGFCVAPVIFWVEKENGSQRTRRENGGHRGGRSSQSGVRTRR